MVFSELEAYLIKTGHSLEYIDGGGQPHLVIKNVTIQGGSHDGKVCGVAILKSDQNPWLPEPKIHVKPHLTTMGQNASQPSPLGADWQYLSRRFDPPPTPHTYFAFILTALGQL